MRALTRRYAWVAITAIPLGLVSATIEPQWPGMVALLLLGLCVAAVVWQRTGDAAEGSR
jgi:hypothetical protein